MLSLRTIRYLFDRWKCGYGRIRELTPVDPIWHAQRIARYIAKYSQALKLVAAGTHIMVWMDESYIWQNCARAFGWFVEAMKKTRDMKRERRIARLIIMHAMMRCGLVCKERSDHDDDLDADCLNAEYVYPINLRAKKSSESKKDDNTTQKDEYHDNVNSTIFLKWLVDRLIKTIEAMYPGKKIILMLDNAAYHNPRGDDWTPVAGMID